LQIFFWEELGLIFFFYIKMCFCLAKKLPLLQNQKLKRKEKKTGLVD
jgi:hypothetical protein